MVHSYYRVKGGECESFEAEAEGLVAAGVEVKILSRDSKQLSTLEKVSLPISQITSRAARSLVVDALDEFKPDVLHVHNTFPLFPREVHELAFARGVPVIQSLHNYRFICVGALLMRDGVPCEECIGTNGTSGVRYGCYNGSKLQSAALSVGNAFYNVKKWRAKALLHFITPSAFARTRFIRAGWDKSQISIKPNLIPEPKGLISPWKDRAGAIYVGRLSEEKGIPELLKAWKNVSLEESLTIVGAGPLEQEVRDAVSKDSRIHYLGKCSRNEVIEHLSKARVLVQPSVCYETFGRTLAEAAAVGTPVVTSSGGALEELAVRSGGLAINGRDLQLLACLLYTSPSPRDKRQSRMPSSA